MTTTDLPLRHTDLDVSEAEDGLVILTADGGQVHHLNGTAALVFELCDGRTSVDAITEAVSGVVPDGAIGPAEVRGCVETLRARGIVT